MIFKNQYPKDYEELTKQQFERKILKREKGQDGLSRIK